MKKAGIITVIYIYPLIIMTLKIALYPLFSWSFALLSVVGGVGNVGCFQDDRFVFVQGIIFFAEALGILWRIRQPVTSVA